MKQRYPNVPPVVTCGAAYWRLVIDSRQAGAMINEFLSGKHTESPAAEDILQKTNAAIEAEKARRALATAPTQTGTEPAQPPTYKPGDQKTLDRLINNNQR